MAVTRESGSTSHEQKQYLGEGRDLCHQNPKEIKGKEIGFPLINFLSSVCVFTRKENGFCSFLEYKSGEDFHFHGLRVGMPTETCIHLLLLCPHSSPSRFSSSSAFSLPLSRRIQAVRWGSTSFLPLS